MKNEKKRTTTFSRMSKKRQRIAIFKDVILQIQSKVIEASGGSVIDGIFVRDLEFGDSGDARSCVLDLRKKKDKSCSVCMRGGLLLSVIAKDNQFTTRELRIASGVGSFRETSVVDTRLSAIFEPYQIALMERAFEGDHNWFALSEKDRVRTVKFFSRYVSPERRMLAICKNAIANDGTFKP